MCPPIRVVPRLETRSAREWRSAVSHVSADQGCSKVGNVISVPMPACVTGCPPIRVVPRLETIQTGKHIMAQFRCPPIRVVPRLETQSEITESVFLRSVRRSGLFQGWKLGLLSVLPRALYVSADQGCSKVGNFGSSQAMANDILVSADQGCSKVGNTARNSTSSG